MVGRVAVVAVIIAAPVVAAAESPAAIPLELRDCGANLARAPGAFELERRLLEPTVRAWARDHAGPVIVTCGGDVAVHMTGCVATTHLSVREAREPRRGSPSRARCRRADARWTGPSAIVRLSVPCGPVRAELALDVGMVVTPTRAVVDRAAEASQGRAWLTGAVGASVEL